MFQGCHRKRGVSGGSKRATHVSAVGEFSASAPDRAILNQDKAHMETDRLVAVALSPAPPRRHHHHSRASLCLGGSTSLLHSHFPPAIYENRGVADLNPSRTVNTTRKTKVSRLQQLARLKGMYNNECHLTEMITRSSHLLRSAPRPKHNCIWTA